MKCGFPYELLPVLDPKPSLHEHQPAGQTSKCSDRSPPPSLWAGRVTGSTVFIQRKKKHETCTANLLLIDLPNTNSNYTKYAKLNVHCKDNIPKIRNKYSQKWNCAFSVPIPTVHSCFCERFIYSHDRSAYCAAGNQADRSWKYINRLQIHECGHWDWGRAVSFLGAHKSYFLCSEVRLYSVHWTAMKVHESLYVFLTTFRLNVLSA